MLDRVEPDVEVRLEQSIGSADQAAGQWIPAPARVRGRLCAGMTRRASRCIIPRPPGIHHQLFGIP